MMVDPGPRCNGVVRTFAVHLLRHPPQRLALIDTASLKDKLPLPREERRKLTITLQALQESDAVLHLIDLSTADPVAADFTGQTHRRLVSYCLHSGKPLLTAGTKVDLIDSRLLDLEQTLPPGVNLIPISSLTGDGFPQLRRQLPI